MKVRDKRSQSNNNRSAQLRARVLRAISEGDPSGSWRRVAKLLDRADRARDVAERQLELGRQLLSEASRD